MQIFLKKIKLACQKHPKRIVFPEGEEPRVLKAISQILKNKIAQPILLGDETRIKTIVKKLKIKINFDKLTIIDPLKNNHLDNYAKVLHQLRETKGLTLDEAKKLITKTNYFGTMMVHLNSADGMVCGSTWTTADTVRPALQIIKTKTVFHKVSGFFFMMLKKKLLLFADCAININPNSHDLKDIAEDTAKTAAQFGLKPRVAFLSFSTNHSAEHPASEKVREAVALFRYNNPKITADGEMQVDTALVPEISARKFPASKIKGQANILIFPDLNSANIAYKLVERLGGFTAVGPILQGLKKPINDLSRGCSATDIVNVTAITVLQAITNNQIPISK